MAPDAQGRQMMPCRSADCSSGRTTAGLHTRLPGSGTTLSHTVTSRVKRLLNDAFVARGYPCLAMEQNTHMAHSDDVVEDSRRVVEDSRRAYIRHRILHEHLQRVIRKTPSNHTLSQKLTLLCALQTLESTTADAQDTSEAHFPGGMSRDDLTDMAPVTLDRILNDRAVVALEDEMQRTLLSIADYLAANDLTEDTKDDEERLQSASQLPQTIHQRKEALAEQQRALAQSRAQVLDLVHRINDAHPELEAELTLALETIPPQLRAARTAQADVLAATIEAALLKLSLLRARAHRALYGFSAPPQAHTTAKTKTKASTSAGGSPQTTVAHAVAAAHEALLARQRAQEEEMRALDGQIAAYEGMLRLVDGVGEGKGREGREGPFAQVVSDMARVKRETEECLQELKRLGWTEG
ncbi:hypothetical protein C8Q70DRAFT_224103 [Cubamyces menziesii]|nr:hypothetical protein C8Q70DRAFT_224103 [Cubamyces menziesii]